MNRDHSVVFEITSKSCISESFVDYVGYSISSKRFLPTVVGKQESSRKTSISALLTMPKPSTVWITLNWKILKEMRIPGHLTCLLRNLYAGQEATVRTGHGTVPNRKRSTSRLYLVTLLI